MALIKCPECSKDISDKSEKCIHCGYPLRSSNGSDSSAPSYESRETKVLTERTSKDIKKQFIIAKVLLYLSVFIILIGLLTNPPVAIFGVVLFVIAIVINAVAKFSKFWDHD
ncbi:MAG: zinc ribbon domain-containing protein [Candidatus Cloacimonadales bacterium]